MKSIPTCICLLLSLLTLPLFAEKPALPSMVIPDGLGYNIHFTDAKPGEMEMIAESGATILRMDFGWQSTEREKGKYDFSAYERLTNSMEKHKIRPLYILDYSNRNYDEGLSPYSDEGRKAFATWAAAAAVHFKDRGILWEMWNEPNIDQFWKPKVNADDYIKLALEVGKALRAAAPDELYIGPATSEMDFDFLEKCFKGGLLEYWDAVSVHPYRQSAPETVVEEYAKLRYMIDKYAPKNKKIPILSGEWGYSSVWGNFDDDTQGKMLPRQWMINLACDIPVSIWYDWHDDGTDPKEPEHHFGTVNYQYHRDQTPVYEPKPAYLAAKTFCETFRGFKYNKRIHTPSYEHQNFLFLFNKDKEVRYAAWTTSKTPTQIYVPKGEETKYRIIDHLGREKPEETAWQSGMLILTDSPIYLIPENDEPLHAQIADFPSLPMVLYATQSNLEDLKQKTASVWFRENIAAPHGPKRTEGLPPAEMFRSPEPIEYLVHFGSPHNTIFSQLTKIISPNPIQIRPSLTGNKLTLQIDNPSGDAFIGNLGYSVPTAKPSHFAINLREGEKQQTVTFELQPIYLVDLRFLGTVEKEYDETESYLIPPERLIFRTIDDFSKYTTESLNAAWGIFPDGDSNVSSEQNIAMTESGLVKITYQFDEGWKFIRLAPKKESLRDIAGEPKELCLRVEGDGSGNSVRLRFADAKGQTFQINGGTMPEKMSYYFSFPLDGTKASHWGGPNDGKISYPIRFDSLIIDGTRQATGPHNIEISSMVLVY